MIPIYMDEHVPAAVTRGLRLRGVGVLTVQEDGTDGWLDPRLLDRARELGRVVFTQDKDFLIEATRRQRLGEPFGGVIYIHQWDLLVGRCIADLELLAQAGNPEDFADQVWYLPLP
jgi:predicted nuclease of predicted toxin-antitoxin system